VNALDAQLALDDLNIADAERVESGGDVFWLLDWIDGKCWFDVPLVELLPDPLEVVFLVRCDKVFRRRSRMSATWADLASLTKSRSGSGASEIPSGDSSSGEWCPTSSRWANPIWLVKLLVEIPEALRELFRNRDAKAWRVLENGPEPIAGDRQ
jgi:hypothetical protein